MAFHPSSARFELRSLSTGSKAHPLVLSEGWASAAFLHRHLRTAASISLATTMGGSVPSSMPRPLSVVMYVALCTVQPTRSRVSTKAAAGPVATLQGLEDSVTLVLA